MLVLLVVCLAFLLTSFENLVIYQDIYLSLCWSFSLVSFHVYWHRCCKERLSVDHFRPAVKEMQMVTASCLLSILFKWISISGLLHYVIHFMCPLPEKKIYIIHGCWPRHAHKPYLRFDWLFSDSTFNQSYLQTTIFVRAKVSSLRFTQTTVFINATV